MVCMILLVMGFCIFVIRSCLSPGESVLFLNQGHPLEPFPSAIPASLSFTKKELPKGYTLSQNQKILEELHLKNNPGYMSFPAEQAALAERGGLCSITALYSQDEVVRVMLNAVYFRDPDALEKFIEVERSKDLHMAVFKKVLPFSIWLIFVASDSEQEYSESERNEFKKMLTRYQSRLRAELIFDRLTVPEREL